MADQLNADELGDERGELLPAREVLSLLADPTSMQVPSLLGGAGTPDTGATDYASGTAAGATDLTSHHLPDAGAGGAYSPNETATAG